MGTVDEVVIAEFLAFRVIRVLKVALDSPVTQVLWVPRGILESQVSRVIQEWKDFLDIPDSKEFLDLVVTLVSQESLAIRDI